MTPTRFSCFMLAAAAAIAQPQTHTVRVSSDGSFNPRTLYIKSGDTVRWENLTRTDSVIPVTGATTSYPAVCSTRAAYNPTDPNDLTGPIPFAPSGVFVMGIHGLGLVETVGTTCPAGLRPDIQIPGKSLCSVGRYQATMDATWRSPNNTGVFIRLLWKDINPCAGAYDFTVLQREMENAVKYGKLFSLSIKAGQNGIPDWIFSTNPNDTPRAGGGGGVPRLHFEDSDEIEAGSCGNKMDLGNPGNPRYQQLYQTMIAETTKFIKSRADWYRALAYIKTSSVNFISEENRIPKHCRAGCVCNPQVWAQGGYRPSGLYSYFDALLQQFRDLLPGKSINYALIQDGFPGVNETGGWETVTGASSDGRPLPGAFEQMQTIMDNAQAKHGPAFVVAHNGVQPKPTARCNFDGQHPKPLTTLDGYWQVGNGCPNRWAVREGAEGQITGYQTTNIANGVSNSAAFESAMINMIDNTDGIYMELYEEIFWAVENTNNGRLPQTGKTLAAFADDLHRRRIDPAFPKMFPTGNPLPTTWSRTFRNSSPSAGPQVINYIHGMKCGNGNQEFGQIILDAQPPAIQSNGVVTASGFGAFRQVAPSSWMEIYGSNFSNTSRGWAQSDFNGASAPSALEGTTVRIGGLPAHIAYISPSQINAQIPANTPLGQQPVTVTTATGASSPFNITVNTTQPGLSAPPAFNINGRQYVVAVFPDGAFVLPPGAIPGVNSRRARPGETITLFGVGFGVVNPFINAGQIVQQTNTLIAPFAISLAGARAAVTYSGLAPSAVGLYQFNVVVPQVASSDAVPLTFTLDAVNGTQSLFTAVQ